MMFPSYGVDESEDRNNCKCRIIVIVVVVGLILFGLVIASICTVETSRKGLPYPF
uniref:Uncharacterized protein n=1 Tax=Pristionchus pacificus TaxID=54126 RepID=A0A8R1YRW4_PRIPA